VTVSAYPLHWPPGFKRTARQTSSLFKVTLPAALNNVQGSLRRFGKDSAKSIGGLVISSNVTLGVSNPDDAGVAVWFTWDGMQVCIPCDRYGRVEENLQAIHYVIEARRTELRHGTLEMVRATFSGFKALPAPEGKHWRDLLKVGKAAKVTPGTIEFAYKSLAKKYHPDAGGSPELMAELNNARDTALSEIG